jgi:hypothetical protein
MQDDFSKEANNKPRQAALRKKARELGVSIYQDGGLDDDNTPLRAVCSDTELQRRVFEAKAHIRASGLWKFALGSAIASIFSALGAWSSFYWKCP